jgi:hypothetical protein
MNHTKILSLQFPFFTTFYLSSNWFPQSVGWTFIGFQIALTSSFSYLSYWLFKNHTIGNLSKKWVSDMISGSGGKSVVKAIEFYNEVAEFEKEKQPTG